MKRGNFVLLMLLTAAVIIFLDKVKEVNPALGSQPPSQEVLTEDLNKQEQEITKEESKTSPKVDLSGSLFHVMGRTQEEIIQQFGQPVRKDSTPYGYMWWIYKKDGEYFQLGISDKEVVTVYSIGPKVSIEPLLTGQTYSDVNDKFELKKEVNVVAGLGTYQFILTEEEVKQRPLVNVDDQLYMQLYFDHFTERLSSVRLLTAEVLLMHRPYEVYYRGELPDKPLILSNDWIKIEEGMEKQIYDITNMIRSRFEESQLEWDQKVASVAFQHSKDMALHNYFSHISPEGKGLQERLKDNKVYYFSAGENIAAQYPDAPSAVEGWLNSKGHREALLNEDYTHLGVGVYRYYYTQNFLEKPL